MTMRLDDGHLVYPNVLVVTFDISSSSVMLDDLILGGKQKQFNKLLKDMHEWLVARGNEFGFEIYKFTGDGWILLFNNPGEQLAGGGLLKCLITLCEHYRQTRRKRIDGRLQTVIKRKGLTFGIDVGEIRKVTLGQREFVGRPLILASRLQAVARSDEDGSPEYVALTTQAVYYEYLKHTDGVEIERVTHRLHNVMGDARYRCRRIDLAPHMREPSATGSAPA
jgi:hypothetical protein